jgi:hypothetical protein
LRLALCAPPAAAGVAWLKGTLLTEPVRMPASWASHGNVSTIGLPSPSTLIAPT